jgi:hypothetical protein
LGHRLGQFAAFTANICLIKIGDFIIWIDVWWFVWHVLWLESKVPFESIERKKELCFFCTPVYFTKLHH